MGPAAEPCSPPLPSLSKFAVIPVSFRSGRADPVSRVSRGRGRAFAPARFARLIARAWRRTHLSHRFLQRFWKWRRLPRGAPESGSGRRLSGAYISIIFLMSSSMGNESGNIRDFPRECLPPSTLHLIPLSRLRGRTGGGRCRASGSGGVNAAIRNVCRVWRGGGINAAIRNVCRAYRRRPRDSRVARMRRAARAARAGGDRWRRWRYRGRPGSRRGRRFR